MGSKAGLEDDTNDERFVCVWGGWEGRGGRNTHRTIQKVADDFEERCPPRQRVENTSGTEGEPRGNQRELEPPPLGIGPGPGSPPVGRKKKRRAGRRAP